MQEARKGKQEAELSSAAAIKLSEKEMPQALKDALKQRSPIEVMGNYSDIKPGSALSEKVLVRFFSKYADKQHLIKYAVFDTTKVLGKGGYGQVYGVIGTLTLNEGEWEFKAKTDDKARVCKVIRVAERSKDAIQKEAEKMKWFDYLQSKGATFDSVDTFGYIVSKRFQDENLFEYLKKERASLTDKDRATIAFNLLSELCLFHERQYVHNDLNVKNIIINRSDLTVKFIDVDFAEEGATAHGRGTPTSVSPEILRNNVVPQDERVLVGMPSDVYAIAIVIAELYGAYFRRGHEIGQLLSENKNDKLRYERKLREYYGTETECYTAPVDLAGIKDARMRVLLSNMLAHDQEKRWSVSEARDFMARECMPVDEREQSFDETGETLPSAESPPAHAAAIPPQKQQDSEDEFIESFVMIGGASKQYSSVFELPPFNRKHLLPPVPYLQSSREALKKWADSISFLADEYASCSPLRRAILLALHHYINGNISKKGWWLFPTYLVFPAERIKNIKKCIEIAVDPSLDDDHIVKNIRYLADKHEHDKYDKQALYRGLMGAVQDVQPVPHAVSPPGVSL